MTRYATIPADRSRPTERDLYYGYIDAGAFGDEAAEMAHEDVAQRELAEFIAAQPAHNSPIPVAEESA